MVATVTEKRGQVGNDRREVGEKQSSNVLGDCSCLCTLKSLCTWETLAQVLLPTLKYASSGNDPDLPAPPMLSGMHPPRLVWNWDN